MWWSSCHNKWERERERGDLHGCMQVWTHLEKRRQPLTFALHRVVHSSTRRYLIILRCCLSIQSGECRRACAWTAGCSSLPHAHLFAGTRCWENAEGHSVHVLPVEANGTVVLPVGELAGQENIGRALPFLALSPSRDYRTLHFFLSREQRTRAPLSHLSQVLILREIFERPAWLIQWAREHLLPLLSLS